MAIRVGRKRWFVLAYQTWISKEEELEQLRSRLYQAVNGLPTRLADSKVVPLSMRLDALIVEIQRAKQLVSQSGC